MSLEGPASVPITAAPQLQCCDGKAPIRMTCAWAVAIHFFFCSSGWGCGEWDGAEAEQNGVEWSGVWGPD